MLIIILSRNTSTMHVVIIRVRVIMSVLTIMRSIVFEASMGVTIISNISMCGVIMVLLCSMLGEVITVRGSVQRIRIGTCVISVRVDGDSSYPS